MAPCQRKDSEPWPGSLALEQMIVTHSKLSRHGKSHALSRASDMSGPLSTDTLSRLQRRSCRN